MAVAVGRRTGARTVVPDDEAQRASFAHALLLFALSLFVFVLIALFMTRNHTWTDRVMAALPLPGARTTLAADPSLVGQVRIVAPRAWTIELADRTPAVVAEARVVNDARVSIRRIVLEGALRADGRSAAVRSALCGKTLSPRLLRRLRADELGAFDRIDVPSRLEPGRAAPCQIVFTGVASRVENVVLRIASVEPDPNHSPPAFLP